MDRQEFQTKCTALSTWIWSGEPLDQKMNAIKESIFMFMKAAHIGRVVGSHPHVNIICNDGHLSFQTVRHFAKTL